MVVWSNFLQKIINGEDVMVDEPDAVVTELMEVPDWARGEWKPQWDERDYLLALAAFDP